MDVERSSLCNCVVNFLLEEKYLLTAFELLQELLDDGRDAQAIRLKEFFSDPSHFPPDLITRFNSLRVADPQSLLEEKEALVEKLAITEYELRLAQEDVTKLKAELKKKSDSSLENLNESNENNHGNHGVEFQRQKRDISFSDLGPLKDIERKDLNCAVKEYLLLAGYRLTAMTFYEEVTDQNLDIWRNTPARVPDALRHYYYQYLSSTTEAAEEKIAMLRENESLLKVNERLNHEKESLLKTKEISDGQISALTKSLEALHRDLKDKENLILDLKKTTEHQRRELNDCTAEITALKMHIEGSHSVRNFATTNGDVIQSQPVERYEEEIKSLLKEIERLRAKSTNASDSLGSVYSESMQTEEKVVEVDEDKTVLAHPSVEVVNSEDAQSLATQTPDNNTAKQPNEVLQGESTSSLKENIASENSENVPNLNDESPLKDSGLPLQSDNASLEAASDKMGLGTIQILADALPKIVPYVLINHREELLPLIMCAIERHPDTSTRDSLTHTLFNLIKRPDEKQRRIIMDACVTLAKNVGEMRTEMELLPQCWEQINHMYEERRLLVAQSCGELAEFVRPEIRDSLILSIVQQLVEDSATVVREAAARNLALLLPLFPNTDKYFKVEDLMFQLVCDPSGVVVETTFKELLPAVINWGSKLDHILRVLLSYILSSAQRCPPLSGVEGSVESHLRVLGERERWNLEVLLRMMAELLPFMQKNAIETCPFSSVSLSEETVFPSSLLELYAGGHIEWPAFEWMHVDCFPGLIQLACLLPQKEDNLRNRITKFLLAVSKQFGDSYLTHIMLPVFMVAVGDNANLTFFPSTIHSGIRGTGCLILLWSPCMSVYIVSDRCLIAGLKPRTAVGERLATMGVLPLLLAGVLGAPSKHDQLADYLRKLLVEGTMKENHTVKCNAEIVNAVRFLCTFEEHHTMVFNILWEMVVSSNIDMKINAANLLKVIVPYINAKVTSMQVLPALVTLGSDQNLNVKYASIDAFGAVAQHFKNDMIVDKIRVQMDAFLEDGSHEATVAVVRALAVAVPHTTERLRDYLLSKIFQLSAVPSSSSDVMRRRERANAFCESIRALDATELSATSVRDFLLPAIQNLLKDADSLDPAHKEALEIIMKDRSGGTLETISKVMGAHLGITSSVTSFFGGGVGEGLLGKKEIAEQSAEPVHSPEPPPPAPAEDTRFMRIMRGNFVGDMLRGKAKTSEDTSRTQNQ
ncbi:lisH domain and HEAT repeat-containing protein KIAA1468 homolog isoform X1 [Citrus clementina]|uniref:lisH domain and HEAT repeat-containing protein KIAA1468 homolog isoform X1 n=1 Tax=Citrus clementina TaxID=85681 RepID=UPI000CED5FF5|nr:lisH domain and HEAT repeat-containing protein KIAA1468 homolog isoform X1 [Citrus x clementina]